MKKYIRLLTFYSKTGWKYSQGYAIDSYFLRDIGGGNKYANAEDLELVDELVNFVVGDRDIDAKYRIGDTVFKSAQETRQ